MLSCLQKPKATSLSLNVSNSLVLLIWGSSATQKKNQQIRRWFMKRSVQIVQLNFLKGMQRKRVFYLQILNTRTCSVKFRCQRMHTVKLTNTHLSHNKTDFLVYSRSWPFQDNVSQAKICRQGSMVRLLFDFMLETCDFREWVNQQHQMQLFHTSETAPGMLVCPTKKLWWDRQRENATCWRV